jgi:glycosyltransferase involved in cell wall biosynthesis
MDPVKGAHRAIKAAQLAGARLVLAGPVQTGQESYFRELIEPDIDGRHVQYVGEVGGAVKQELFANAAALLMPVRWREPFGMVMIEAPACGTPVIAFAEGAAAEIVIDSVNGLLVADEAQMTQAIGQVGLIDPRRCRTSVAARYDIFGHGRRISARLRTHRVRAHRACTFATPRGCRVTSDDSPGRPQR